MTPLPSVVVVGRPNVGKSALVNRLSGRRDAIVAEAPGVTRDRTAHHVQWRGHRFALVDTGGWRPGARDLDAAVAAQAETAARTADLALLVVDAGVGVTEEDDAVAHWLRAGLVPVLLVANKVDTPGPGAAAGELASLYALGVGDPVAVSALHGLGSGDLLDLVTERLADAGAFDRSPAGDAEVPGVALLGRPNVGKSSLFNRLVGEERAIVHDRPGTTRDAVDTVVRAGEDRVYRFVDTAGLRRRARRGPATEYYSGVRAVRALARAAVALLVLDAAESVGEQDQRLARQVLDAGRGLVLVLNKWDLVDTERRERLDCEHDRLLSFAGFAPLVRTSALSGRGVAALLPAVDRVLGQWRRRVATAQLNRWLRDAVAHSPPPLHAGRAVRLRYVTQPAVAPPTFRVFGTGPVPEGYVRYLERRLRDAFGFEGTPLDVAARVRPRWEERG